ncbi:AraC family transcriptional regulator [Brevibacillus nitrificans]|uniref:AraC family transcriptional regulator n=1 Tax=Brevibacillus nitrificans TaxID=651560 RepID=A0A3M8D4Y9_9BACL|nr:AraC family transcriptional regulator [Brevibacillus nitrificans]RNB83166.1 AraC family transcriptional regulator [Brevibacillus nitrificans]
MDSSTFHHFLENGLGDVLFKLRDIEWVKGDRHGRLQQQFTPSYVMVVVTGGNGRLTLETEGHQLRKDAVYLCPPHATFGIDSESLEEIELFLLRFDVYSESAEHSHLIQGEKLEAFIGEIPIQSAGQLGILCHTILGHWQQEDGFGRFQGQLAFSELLLHIFKHQNFIGNDSKNAVKLAKAYLEEHYAEDLSIEQLARIAQVSPKYFVDLYKKTFGISAMDYLGEVRLNKAKQLMAKSPTKLRDIAHQVGYHDEFYFSRKFKKEVGVSPTVYMKSRQRKIAVYHAPLMGYMLALKMIPYAAPLHPKWTAYYHKMYRNDVPVHLSAFRQMQDWEANIETLTKARPDLILSLDDLTAVEKERLEEGDIPVFTIPAGKSCWREQLLATAERVGEQAEAESWLRAFNRKTEERREQLHRVMQNETVAILRIWKGSMYLHCNRSMGEVFYGDLQMNPAFPSDAREYDMEMTLEQLALLDPEHLLLLICQEAETLEYWKALKQSIGWKELKAVRANKVSRIPADPWREYSATAHDRLVDEAFLLLTGDRPK